MLLVGQILRCRQRDTRGDDALDDGVICKIKEHSDVIGHAALLKCPPEILRNIVFNAHSGKYNTELLIAVPAKVGLQDQLGCQLIVRQAVPGEDRELLTADQRCKRIDRGDSRIDIISRILTPAGIERHAVHIDPHLRGNRPQIVDRTADAVESPAEDILRQSNLHRVTGQNCPRIAKGHAVRAFKYLDDSPVLIALDNSPYALCAVLHPELDDLIVSGSPKTFEDDKRTVNFT